MHLPTLLLLTTASALPASLPSNEETPIEGTSISPNDPTSILVPRTCSCSVGYNGFQVETWSGTSCSSGDALFWTFNSGACTSLGNVKSLKITSQTPAACPVTLFYYSDSNCQSSMIGESTVGNCDGYAGGVNVRSFRAIAPACSG
ncbi:hypothetical protein MMC30_006929 [Trapelia coarctata]|nr:hypothetical protein [Trapelia coarctata]